MLIIVQTKPCFLSTFWAKLLAVAGINLFCAVAAYFLSMGGLNNVNLLLNCSPSHLASTHMHRPSHTQYCTRLFLYKQPCQQIHWSEWICSLTCVSVQHYVALVSQILRHFCCNVIRKIAMIMYPIHYWSVLVTLLCSLRCKQFLKGLLCTFVREKSGKYQKEKWN